MTSEETRNWMVAIGTLLGGCGALLAAWVSWIKSKPATTAVILKPKTTKRRPIDKQIEKQFYFIVFAFTLGFISLMYWIGFASHADGGIILISVVFWANILMSMILFSSALIRIGQLHEIRGVEIYKESRNEN